MNALAWTSAVVAAALFPIVPFALGDEKASKLAERLASSDREIRRDASYELGKLGPEASEALPALIKALGDPDKQVWSNAVMAIANLGPAAKDAIPALLEDLGSRKSRGGREREKRQGLVRSAYALTRIGPAAVPALIETLSVDDSLARQGAAKALGGMGPAAGEAVPALCKNLGHSDAEVRREVVEALAQIGSEAVAPLSDALGAQEPVQRESAALALAQLGIAAKGAAAQLLQLLEAEREPEVRAAALSAVSKVGLEAERVVPLLIAGLKSDNEAVRHAATDALLLARSARPITVRALTALLRDPDPAFRQRAAHVLGRCGGAAVSAVPALVEVAAAQQPAPPEPIEALAQIGAVAAPEILRSVQGQDPDGLSREHWTVGCLARIGPTSVPALCEGLTSPSVPVRLIAARACGEIASDAIAAAPALFKACRDADARVRAAALGALVATRVETAQLLPHLEAALKDSAPVVRVAALQFIPQLGAASQPLSAAVVGALRDQAPMVRRAALDAVGPRESGAVPVLVEDLADASLQPAVIEALGKIGAAAEMAVPRLLELLPQASKETRVRIFATLANTGSQSALPQFAEAMKDTDAEIRASAIAAYAKVERDPAAVLAASLGLLTDASPEVRRAAAGGLARLGPQGRDAAPQLLTLLDRNEDRAFALETLRQIEVRSVPQLLPLLNHRDEAVRVFACERLARLGPEAREAAPALQQLAQAEAQPDSVRREARRALRQINPK